MVAMKTTLLLVVLFSSPALGQSPESLRLEGAQAFAALAAPRLAAVTGQAALPQAGFAVYRDTTTGLAWSFSSMRMDWRSAGIFCDARGGKLPDLEVLRALRVAGLVPQPGPGDYRWDAWSTEEYSYPHPGWSAAYIDITSGEWGVSRKTFAHGAACLHKP